MSRVVRRLCSAAVGRGVICAVSDIGDAAGTVMTICCSGRVYGGL